MEGGGSPAQQEARKDKQETPISEGQSFDLLSGTPCQPLETQNQGQLDLPGSKISEDLAANPVERDLFSELESWADKPEDSPISQNQEKTTTRHKPPQS